MPLLKKTAISITLILLGILLLYPLLRQIGQIRKLETRFIISYAHDHGKSLTAYDFNREAFKKCDFSNFQLAHSDFSGAYLNQSDFSGANLEGANLSSAFIEGSSFRSADLGSAKFNHARLFHVNFQEANMASAKLTYCTIWHCDFRNANLTAVTLEGSYYDFDTQWPKGFNPKQKGGILRIDDP